MNGLTSRTRLRLIGLPAHLALLSALGLAGTVFFTSTLSEGIQAWKGLLGQAWTSWAVIPFVLGNGAVAWRAADLSRRGNLGASGMLALAGTYISFYLSALIMPVPGNELITFDPLDLLVLVPWVGWAGLLAGTAIPVAWGRMEARRARGEATSVNSERG